MLYSYVITSACLILFSFIFGLVVGHHNTSVDDFEEVCKRLHELGLRIGNRSREDEETLGVLEAIRKSCDRLEHHQRAISESVKKITETTEQKSRDVSDKAIRDLLEGGA